MYVGYEDYGKVLLLITGNNNQPERIPLDKALQDKEKRNRIVAKIREFADVTDEILHILDENLGE